MKNIRFLLIYISGFSLITLIVSLFLGVGSIVSGTSNPSLKSSLNPSTPSTPNPQPTFLPAQINPWESHVFRIEKDVN